VQLCFLLASGSSAFSAGSQIADNDPGYAAVSVEYNLPAPFAADKLTFVLSETSSGFDLADIIDDDVEDEDAPSFVGGISLKNNGLSAYTYPSFGALLHHGSNCFRDLPCPAVDSTQKYLQQGVLRI
jgi:hypothetical protein